MAFKMVTPSTIDDTTLTSSTVAEPSGDDPVEYNAANNFSVGDFVFVGAGFHLIYICIQAHTASGGAQSPTATGSLFWTVQRSTNKFKAFDQFIGDPTTRADSAAWTINISDVVNSVALFGLSAATVQVVMLDTDGIERYNETIILDDNTGVVDWFTYWFSPVVRRTNVVLTDLPPYADASVTVTVTDTGNTVLVGQLIVGLFETLGSTTMDQVDLGIDDFSRKERDVFGRFSIIERNFADTMALTFVTDTSRLGYIKNRLAGRRSLPTVYAVDTQYLQNEYVIYGFFPTMQPLARHAEVSEIRIELEGLV
jgi:hypothetical protein